MARNKKTTDEKYNQTFARIFRSLLDEPPRTSQAEIADAIGKSRQIVSQYYNGQSEPTFEVLVKIADFFEVSTDFLLGRTGDRAQVPTPVDSLGLTEDNVRLLEMMMLLSSSYAVPCMRKGVLDSESSESLLDEARSFFGTKKQDDRKYEQALLGALGSSYLDLVNDLINATAQNKLILADYMTVAVEARREARHNDLPLLSEPVPDFADALLKYGCSSISHSDMIRFKSSEIGNAISKYMMEKNDGKE